MDDYIKREDAVRRIAVLMASEAESDGCEDQPMDNFIEYASEDLADIPSADVAPVRHGKWIVLQQTSMPTMWNCKCSECGAYETKTPKYQANYCPNCGAKMDEEKDDEL